MATAAATTRIPRSSNIQIPQCLVNFFARYPPRLHGVYFTGEQILSKEQKIALEGNRKTGAPPTVQSATSTRIAETPVVVATAPASESTNTTLESTEGQSLDSSSLLDPETSQPIFNQADRPPNPFLPYKNPATGRWRGPVVSLRRQAVLYKIACRHGIEELLPASRKSPAFKEQRLLNRGLAVKGTGEGQRVKGHKWERQLEGTLQKRIEAMERMPELIREWRMRGNGKGWKKFPK